MRAVLTIEIWSDVVCPWCYLGKRRLEAALCERPQLEVALRWRPFELNPDMPPGGADRRDYMARKFGADGRLREIHARLVALGREAGIDYRFDAIGRVPNTRAAHALVALAGDRQDAVVEGLFRAYFEEARDVGDRGELVAIGTAAGIGSSGLLAQLAEAERLAAVEAEEHAGARLGISGVPFFVLAGRWAISGAQEPAMLVGALDEVAAALARDPREPAAPGP